MTNCVQPLNGGENSIAFAVDVPDKQYVMRINKKSQGFRKDMFAALHFGSDKVPIPPVVTIGEYHDRGHYALSHLVTGQSLAEQPPSEELFSDLAATLFEINEADVSATKGFGPWDEHGQGRFESWSDSIRSRVDRLGIESVCHSTFLDRKLCEVMKAEILHLLDTLPTTDVRCLLHGNLHGHNILMANGRTTGVIDWEHAAYGDFLYDIADTDLWTDVPPEKKTIKERAYEHYQSEGRDVPHFHERIRCYQLLIVLEVFSFYAHTNQFDKYKYLRSKVFGKRLIPGEEDGSSPSISIFSRLQSWIENEFSVFFGKRL